MTAHASAELRNLIRADLDEHGPSTISEIADRCDDLYSRAAVATAIRRLTDDQVVHRVAVQTGGHQQPPTPVYWYTPPPRHPTPPDTTPPPHMITDYDPIHQLAMLLDYDPSARRAYRLARAATAATYVIDASSRSNASWPR